MEEVLAAPDALAALVAEHGSALNLHDFTPLARNAAELVDAAAAHGVEARVFVARKANKTFGLVEAARAAGLGIDVASFAELDQCLDAGMAARDLIVSAAVKSEALARRAIRADVPLSLDNADEAATAVGIARDEGRVARVALRLAVVAEGIAPTRFGLTPAAWLALLDTELAAGGLRIEGVHFHLNGYSPDERAEALRQACGMVDALRARNIDVAYIDMGGGVPMRYLDDPSQWRAFWEGVAAGDDLTWRGDRLGLVDPAAPRPSPAVYPYWQAEVRAGWLGRILTAPGSDGGTVAQMLNRRGLRLHCEPGRAVVDGCGMTVARVAFRKQTSDGIGLVGLEMNRTQVRSTSADFLVDPRWVRPRVSGVPGPPTTAFVVGAYCIEEELILRRRLSFPDGVAVGDLAVFPNTGGYLMHILESASHQLPLARNLVRDPRTATGWRLDRIDDPGRAHPRSG
ncbi:alanine racemase [Nocardioides sp.]|uniref:alanine racemase n=1 Tax=Nocardioides sp. TaxID=35761 RepID=UPI002638FC48|nr:alanine racemase [Nocardioides sp.]